MSILQLLIKHGELTVERVARELNLSPTTTSQYLRVLNARGLLAAKRNKRFVFYSLGADPSIAYTEALLNAVLQSLCKKKVAISGVFHVLTAFTHPRRVHIVKILCWKPMTPAQLVAAIGASPPAVLRHLDKLKSRGLVRRRRKRYLCCRPKDVLRRTLLRIIAQRR
ncbi:MAG: ArsR family transcriptional regulator [Kiritimatiellae bacterium]|nr:ArsR family transcriptional regulator [Kiritimatiellia bacterium]